VVAGRGWDRNRESAVDRYEACAPGLSGRAVSVVESVEQIAILLDDRVDPVFQFWRVVLFTVSEAHQ